MRTSSYRLQGCGLLLGVALSVSPSARAEIVTGPCAAVTSPNNAPSTDPRVDHLLVDGVHVTVLVPPDYRRGHRRYPVLYLFHGAFDDEDTFTSQTDVIAFTAQLHNDEQAIVVMPDGGHLPAGRDWMDGTHPHESFVIDTLLPYVDRHYRTRGDRGHRAAAGFSGGGLDAMVFAARHPDLFAAAGSFSGFLDPYAPVGIDVILQFAALDNQLCGANIDPLGIWGDPALQPMGWVGHDPVDLARNLADVSVYVASANGVPCADHPDPDPQAVFAEGVVFDMSRSFDEALTAAGIPHVTDFLACGVHETSNSNHDLRRFWPQMFEAFGGHPPDQFDYRTSDPTASVWDWTFEADAGRAPEFLDVEAASSDGLTLVGSGATLVTTPPLFHARQLVSVESGGLAPQRIRASQDGRLAFTLDLGAPHTLEQGTPEQIAVASSNPSYFSTRTVRFLRCPARSEEASCACER